MPIVILSEREDKHAAKSVRGAQWEPNTYEGIEAILFCGQHLGRRSPRTFCMCGGGAPSISASSPHTQKTAMHGIHEEAGGRMVPFEGYELPVQYKGQGIVKETTWCREAASLFDVSHMGQVRLTGEGADALLQRITPTDVASIQEGEARYSMLLNEHGGIVDDCIITRMPGYLNVVLNAGCKAKDLDFIHRQLNAAKLDGTVGDCHVDHRDDQQLVALQGPQAAAVLQELSPVEDLATMSFMQARDIMVDTGSGLHKVFVVRCGYTGEDGFELSFQPDAVQDLVRRLGAHPSVQLGGLGARDALRLEAGLPLYGADITESTTPVEAGLLFAISACSRSDHQRVRPTVARDSVSQVRLAEKQVGFWELTSSWIRSPTSHGSESVSAYASKEGPLQEVRH